MKRLYILTIAFMLVATDISAQQLVRFGLTGGVNPDEIQLDDLKMENRENLGFFFGATLDVKIPVLPLSVDISALYDQEKMTVDGQHTTLNYMQVPVNLKWHFGLGGVLSIYVAAGPQFSFPIGDKKILDNEYRLKDSQLSANIGGGLYLLNHLVVGYRYNIAIGDTADKRTANEIIDTMKQNNGTHHVFLTYYF